MAVRPIPKRTGGNDPAERRYSTSRGPAPVAAAAARVAAPILKKRGLAEARIVTDWRAIVGDTAAERSAPERLVRTRHPDGGGTLRLRVVGAWALEFQHMAPALIARINAYFGYPAVTRIQFIQAPLPAARRAAIPPAPLKPEAEARLAALTAKIDDPELRERVLGLGRALEQRAVRAAQRAAAKPAGPGRKPV